MNFKTKNILKQMHYMRGYLDANLNMLQNDFIISDDEVQDIIKDTLHTLEKITKINPCQYMIYSYEYISRADLNYIFRRLEHDITTTPPQ